jgi:pimeloyl-ACP methyl ester carboxylesterase
VLGPRISREIGVNVITCDGVTLVADVRARPGAPAAVVVVHGLAADRGDGNVVGVADALHDAGYAVVTFDGRGHGSSSGACTLGDDERHDVAAAVAVARDLAPEVIVVGASMGAIATLRHAAADPTLAGVVVVSCPARWRLLSPQAALAALLTRTSPGRRILRSRSGVRLSPSWDRPTAPIEVVRAVRCPVAVVHGTADRFVPAAEARALYAAAAEPRRLELVKAMGHAFTAESRAAIVSAVRWCQSPTG